MSPVCEAPEYCAAVRRIKATVELYDDDDAVAV